jgi:hypothetical protein
MNGEVVATLQFESWKASVYSHAMPGEFSVVYFNSDGNPVERDQLTGISTYHQREPEIMARLQELAHGAEPRKVPDLGDSGEYSG